MEVTTTLQERGKRYGEFADHAKISQSLKDVMRKTNGWDRLSADQKEALEMVVHKIGRILNGDPNYADSWHDIAGYAVLVEKVLGGEATAEPVQTFPVPSKAPELVVPKPVAQVPGAEAPKSPAAAGPVLSVMAPPTLPTPPVTPPGLIVPPKT